MKKEINKIALVRLSALGDIINSAVVLQFIRQQYPHAEIEWITEEIFAPLLQDHPFLFKVHTINLKALKKEKSLSKLFNIVVKLKNLGEYDLIIDMQGLIKSALTARFIGKNTHGFSKNSTREPFASYFYKSSSTIAYEENVIKRNCFIVADALQFSITDAMILNKQPVFPFEKIEFPHAKKDKKDIALVIGASWESKRYPKELIVKLCNNLEETCHIIWGNEAEKKDGMWICENSHFTTLAPQLSLPELVSFISSCDLLIGNDTGPTHLAWAQNIPSITLLGPTTTRMIYETPKNIGIKSTSQVDVHKINKNDFSITEISVEEITKKVLELLQ